MIEPDRVDANSKPLHWAVLPAAVTLIAAFVFLLFRSAQPGLTPSSIPLILESPGRFDNRAVLVQGRIGSLEFKKSKKGNPYTLLTLQDPQSPGRIKVFSWGHPPLKPEQSVTVQGRFVQSKKLGAYTFQNQIEADSIR